MDKVRFGIIGIGNMGSTHARNLFEGRIPGGELAAVCDVNPARLKWAEEKFGDKVVRYEDYHDLLNSGKVDAVIIATPHYFHPIIGIDAFNAGLNVLSEKPIGVYTKKVQEFMDVAEKSGKVFGIMYNQRTDKAYQKMREIVQSGELGTLKRSVWIITNWYRTQYYYNSGGWRATWAGEGGGVLINQDPHELDLWQWIFGMPSRIHAFCQEGHHHDIEVEDEVTAYAEYPNGATGVFITTTGEYPGTDRLEITGSKGRLVYEDGKLTYMKLKVDEREFTKTCQQGFCEIENEVIDIDVSDHGEQHVGILKDYVSAILNGTELLAPGMDGIKGLSISNAMMLSSWKNDWVELPNDGSEFLEYLEEKIKHSKVKENVESVILDTEGSYNAK